MGEKISKRELGETHVSVKTRRTLIASLIGYTLSRETNLCEWLSRWLEHPSPHLMCVAASCGVGDWT